MSTSPRSRGLCLGTVALALGTLIAGCGSSGTAASSPSSTAAAGSSSVGTPPPSSAPANAPLTASASAQPVDLSGHFCADARAENTRSQQLTANFTAAATTPAALKALEQSLGSVLVQFKAEAPDQLKQPVAVLVAGDQQLLSALAAAGYDVTKISPTALSSLDTPAFEAAAKTVSAYLQTTCHIAPAS